jgi:hypothetical protein
MATELTTDEQMNARKLIDFLLIRFGGWVLLCKALHCSRTNLTDVLAGRADVSPGLVFRMARVAGVPIDDVIRGRYPASDMCPHCGRCG